MLKQRRQNKLLILRDTNFDILIVIQVIDAYKSKDIQDHQLMHDFCIIFYIALIILSYVVKHFKLTLPKYYKSLV